MVGGPLADPKVQCFHKLPHPNRVDHGKGIRIACRHACGTGRPLQRTGHNYSICPSDQAADVFGSSPRADEQRHLRSNFAGQLQLLQKGWLAVAQPERMMASAGHVPPCRYSRIQADGT
jgi:hypothetical protein